CVYCQRSHMSCNDERPCQRCIKRSIAHMCHDKDDADASEARKPRGGEIEDSGSGQAMPPQTDALQGVPPVGSNAPADDGSTGASEPTGSTETVVDTSVLPILASGHSAILPASDGAAALSQMSVPPLYVNDPNGTRSLPLSSLAAAAAASPLGSMGPGTPLFGEAGAAPFDRNSLLLFGNDVASNEFTALTEFLDSLQRGMRSVERAESDAASSAEAPRAPMVGSPRAESAGAALPVPQFQRTQGPDSDGLPTITQLMGGGSGVTQTERFVLTAADPNDGTSEDKLRQIINAKYEAGILKPYNYVSGYARMQRFMETNLSRASIVRILGVVNTFRPTFRSVAAALTDIDLLLVEEGFERLLLDYDNVFNSFGVPACLWRRTGEIYKANREFADLVGVPLSFFHEGRVCIYEIMSEASTVNYWDKYGEIAFDASQKAVLTTCVLQTSATVRSLVQRAAKGLGDARPMSSSSIALKISGVADQPSPSQPGRPVRCCFSFTLRRDKYKIPIAIIGNFIPIA
ncbi:Transcription factor, partial [Coemansia sp. RSA 2705]